MYSGFVELLRDHVTRAGLANILNGMQPHQKMSCPPLFKFLPNCTPIFSKFFLLDLFVKMDNSTVMTSQTINPIFDYVSWFLQYAPSTYSNQLTRPRNYRQTCYDCRKIKRCQVWHREETNVSLCTECKVKRLNREKKELTRRFSNGETITRDQRSFYFKNDQFWGGGVEETIDETSVWAFLGYALDSNQPRLFA